MLFEIHSQASFQCEGSMRVYEILLFFDNWKQESIYLLCWQLGTYHDLLKRLIETRMSLPFC